MTKFVNTGADVDLYFPEGHPDSLPVKAGQIVDIGDLQVEDGGDCWLVGEGDNVRAWSKDRWQRQGGRPKPAEKTTAEKTTDKPADQPAE